MKKNYAAALAICLTTILNAQTLNSEWTVKSGGSDADVGEAIQTDSNGNIYVAGRFLGTADFDPGPLVESVMAQGGEDIFIQKLDQNGDLLWVNRIGGFGDEEVFSILIDNNDDVYVTGSFEGTVDFDPGILVNNMSSLSSEDMFIQKLDANGNLIWVKQIEGGWGASTLDPNGYIYTVGTFIDTLDLDPNAGVSEVVSAGQADIFIQKLDLDGNFVWGKSEGGSDMDHASAVCIDANGNVCITGGFNGVADFDPDAGVNNLTSQGFSDIFIQKLDASGGFVWAKQMGSNGFDGGSSITADENGDLYVAGNFMEAVDFDPSGGTTVLTSVGFADAFVLKLNPGGDLLWAKDMGGDSFTAAEIVHVLSNGEVLSVGTFQGTSDFDPSNGSDSLTSQGFSDIFMQLLDANGNYLWTEQIGGTSYDLIGGVDIDNGGAIYTTGSFIGTVDFSPFSPSNDVLTSVGIDDVFVQKLHVLYAGLSEGVNGHPFSIYPNPSKGDVFIDLGAELTDVKVNVMSAQGSLIYSQEYANAGLIHLDLDVQPGTYFAEIVTSTSKNYVQFVKQ